MFPYQIFVPIYNTPFHFTISDEQSKNIFSVLYILVFVILILLFLNIVINNIKYKKRTNLTMKKEYKNEKEK